ncbi:MAG: hypothetical protein ACEQSB_03380 [Undibacterium sp.]
MNISELLSNGLDLANLGFEIKNLRDLTRIGQVFRMGTGLFRPKAGASAPAGTDTPSQQAGSQDQDIAAGKKWEDELFALLAYLGVIKQADSTPITAFKVPSAQAHLFPALIATMKPGAGKNLVKALAVKLTVVKKRRPTGETVDVPRRGGGTQPEPVYETNEEFVNVQGEKVVAGLSWLCLHISITEDVRNVPEEVKRLEKVASLIERFALFRDFKEDATAAAAELKGKTSEQVARFMAWFDTKSHVIAALIIIGPNGLQDLIAPGTIGERHLLDIQVEQDQDRKRQLQENFQQFLVQAGKSVQRGRTVIDRKKNRRWLMVAGSIALVSILLLTLVGKLAGWGN